MTIAKRLTKIMKERGLIQRDLAKAAGITRQAFGRYLAGDAMPNKEKLEKIAAFLNVSPSYLMFGESESEFEAINDENATIQIQSVDSSEPVRMLRVKKGWLSLQSLNPNFSSLRIIVITGDNMKPTINPGEITLIDTSVNAIQTEGIYVIDANGQRLIKRAQRKVNGDLLLIDDNSLYCHTTLTREEAKDITVIGKCVFTLKAHAL